MIGRLLPCGAALLAVASPAWAEERQAPALDLGADLTLDMVTLARGGADSKARVLSNLDLLLDADMERLAGWRGFTAHVHVLDNRGARPNDFAGTLQGINNIEVPEAGTRLFEAFVQQELPSGASVLAGLYDVNSEFYASEAAGLLVAPPFGIGSEFAATGPNGPSIFPSSALAVRVQSPIAARGRVQFAALNAHARTLGDHGGINFDFDAGLLLVGEAGVVEGPLRASFGGWAYTEKQESIIPAPPGQTAATRRAQGGYGMVEADVSARLQWFLRAGFSSGNVSPFNDGFQTGFLMQPALTSRPESALSIGMHHADINRTYRNLLLAEGTIAANDEQAYAVAYADQLFDQVSLQGDVQWIRNPGADALAREEVVTTLRLTISL